MSLTTNLNTPNINLHDPNTFRNATLNTEQFNKRYQILQELEEELDKDNKILSPKSRKELTDLSEIFKRNQDTVLTGVFPVHRLSTPFYFVKFGVTTVDKYREVENRIIELPKTGVGVIEAVQPSAADNWFHKAITMQTTAVFTSGFLDALRNAFIANMCLLRASTLLVDEPTVFRQVLALYGNSHDLYQDQIAFNRSVETNLLASAEDSHIRIESFHRQILKICGSNIQDNPDVIKEAIALHEEETTQSLKLYTELRNHCDKFLGKITALEKNVISCIKGISKRQDLIEDAIGKINALMLQQQELDKKKEQMQKEFDDYQRLKEKEWNTRKEEKVSGRSISLLGIPIWTESDTIRIVEANFGSSEAYKNYLRIRSEEKSLAQDIEAAKANLTNSMISSGILYHGQDPAHLDKVIKILSSAIASIKVLESALYIRKSQAETQIETCKSLLRTGGKGMFNGVDEVLGFLDASISRVVKQKSLWLESNRQTFTLQECRRLEGGIRLKVTTALAQLAQGDNSAITSMAEELKQYLPEVSNTQQIQQYFEMRLVNNQRMLEMTKEKGTA